MKGNNLEPYFSLSGNKNIYNALRKAFRSYFKAKTEREWIKKLGDWRKEFEFLLSRAVAYYLVDSASISKVQKLLSYGWIVPPYAVKVYEGGDPFEYFKPFLEESFLKERFDRYGEIDFLSSRKAILDGVLNAFLSGFTEIAIYGLFVQIEGVVWEIFVKKNPLEADIESLIRKRNRKFITIQYALKLITASITEEGTIPEFFDCIRFVDFKDDGRLNRNAVMHGISVNFGSKRNFLKLFLLFEFLIYLGMKISNHGCTK